MEKLKKIQRLCKYGVYLRINPNRDEYKTVEEYINGLFETGSLEKGDIDNIKKNKMIELDTIIELSIYPYTPVGFYSFYHYDLEQIADKALKALGYNK